MADKDAGWSRDWVELPPQLFGGGVGLLTCAPRRPEPAGLEHVNDGVGDASLGEPGGGLQDLLKLVSADGSKHQLCVLYVVVGPVEAQGTVPEEPLGLFGREQHRDVPLGDDERPDLA